MNLANSLSNHPPVLILHSSHEDIRQRILDRHRHHRETPPMTASRALRPDHIDGHIHTVLEFLSHRTFRIRQPNRTDVPLFNPTRFALELPPKTNEDPLTELP